MNTALLIYLVMQLDNIRDLFGVILVFSLIMSGVALFFMILFVIDHDTDNETYIAVSRWFKRGVLIALASAIIFTVIPSTKTAIYMIGGAGVVELLQSEQAQEVGGKAYQLLMKKLNKELAE